ncbi:unnamed protein product [Musa hybrid cultivar]
MTLSAHRAASGGKNDLKNIFRFRVVRFLIYRSHCEKNPILRRWGWGLGFRSSAQLVDYSFLVYR